MAHAQTATLVADASSNALHPAANYGALSNLYVSSNAAAYLLFDLGALPAGTTPAQVEHATLRLYANRVDAAGAVSVSPVRAAWTESGVTWESAPAAGASIASLGVAGPYQYVAVDVTAQVQAWVASPATNFGLALTATSASVVFDSKENDETSHPAVLEIALVSQGPAGPAGAQGAAGVAGPQGPAGVAGAQGPQGVAGSQGVQGLQGVAGVQGLPGAVFRGAYAAPTNYGVGDVVTWANAAWISSAASNLGNTPDASPAFWNVLVPAAVGLQGVAGPQGAQGPQGFVGAQGPAGADGAQGPQGAAGAMGRPGLIYQGAYQATTNYAAGDVVLWNGGSWSSLAASNLGNTPDSSPTFWGALTLQGPPGVTGAAGAQGPPGAQGVEGPQGPQGERGLQGVTGEPGAQGAPGQAGAPGVQGAAGTQGAQGPAGPVGLNFRSAYDATVNYAMNDAVTWSSQTWLSLSASNLGNTPDVSPAFWTLLAARGAVGATGADGAQGPIGPQGLPGAKGDAGAAGSQGPAGATGTAGANFIGAYDATHFYALHDVVTSDGSAYISLADGNVGNAPALPGSTAWNLLASKGDVGTTGTQGPQGVPGSQGVKGDAGPQGAAGAQGAVGSQGPQGPQGAKGDAGSQGEQGVQGAAGATGPAGLVWRGTYSPSTTYNTGDAVALDGASYVSRIDNNTATAPTISGSAQWALLSAKGDAGVAGAAGSNGANGVAATVQVGTVVSGAMPGVLNVGTPNAAVLNFVVPQGAAGANGLPGLTWRGAWSLNRSYASNDGVSEGGSSYIALQGNIGQDPATDVANNGSANWAVLASQGNIGAPGAASITIGAVSGGASASVTNSGTQNAAVLNFVLPKGDAGAQGVAGAPGINFRGVWNAAVAYAVHDAATEAGSTYLNLVAVAANANNPDPATDTTRWALLAAAGTAGEQGSVGPAGPGGAAATVSVVSAIDTTGTQATVANIGDANAAVLKFTIPQTTSGGGTGGMTYASIHTVTGGLGANLFYGAMSDTHATSESNAVLSYLPNACTTSAVSFYNTGPTDATVLLRSGTAAASMTTELTCTAKAGSASTCNAGTPVTLQNFVDFKITTSTTTATNLWTSFSCQ